VHRSRRSQGGADARVFGQLNLFATLIGLLSLRCCRHLSARRSNVRSLIVVDAQAEVTEWHEQGSLPLGKHLTHDRRCRFVDGDLFAMSYSADGSDSRAPGRHFDALLPVPKAMAGTRNLPL